MDISLNSCNTWFSHRTTKFYNKVPIYQSSVVDPDQLANSLQDFFRGILPSSSWMLEKIFCDGQREGYKPRCILKTRLNEETDTVKKLTEERDSFQTAIQIVTKDLMNLSDNRLMSNSNQLSDENRSRLKNISGGQRKKKPKPWDPPQHVNHQNRFEPLRQEDSVKDSTPSSNADKSFTAVLLDDSMIKQMQGWRLGRKVGHHVVVKSFPGATTRNMKLPDAYHCQEPSTDYSPCGNELPSMWPYSNRGGWEHCRPCQENWNEI